MKLSVILYCGGATISHVQVLLPGYISGKEGLVMVPFGESILPPHVSIQTYKDSDFSKRLESKLMLTFSSWYYKKDNVKVGTDM